MNLASDNYNRANQTGWGTASDGTNTWSLVRGSTTPSISSNAGIDTGNSGPYAIERCGTGTSADTEQVTTFTRSSTGDVAGLVFRYTDNNNWYSVNIGEFTQNLVFSKMVSGSYSDVAFGSNATYATGTTWSIKVRNIGTSIKARIWDASGAEPISWNIDTTDSSLSGAGGYGIVLDPAGASPITFTSYNATDGSSSTQAIKNIATRFRLQSANQLKDIATRFRLQSASQLRNLAMRFRLQSANQLKNISFRLRLQSANKLRDISTRFRLAAGNTNKKDIAMRFGLINPNQGAPRTVTTAIAWYAR